MPDLTTVADVLLGKLGYGTVSECVDSCTPFCGLKLLLAQEGVGIELSRVAYEAGDWTSAVGRHGRWAAMQKRKCVGKVGYVLI
ncbi:hypothetical protein BDR05DRAFT_964912 [Suillus weaverae]|nr:hypothetical protein BDR05DRAFT_964912 [Suillus weaverae]